ncbi:MAG: hypothetical protein GY795_10790 [Desulfobacterales bacterium]|nr:hypothetical protein [Desulfobacterales bacterium]
MTADHRPLKIIVVGDGDTDYLFFEKAIEDDPDLSSLPISIVKPEDIGLMPRKGGGHKTLLKDASKAAYKAAKGFADAVLVLVDNDGDARFKFPHSKHCGNCRECEAWNTLEEIQQLSWAQPFKKGAAILFQALETLLLSARSGFTPQIEESLYSKALKIKFYGQQTDNMTEAFKEKLEQTDMTKIRARSYPRMKKILTAMVV